MGIGTLSLWIGFAFGYGYYYGICKFIDLSTPKATTWEHKAVFKKMAEYKGNSKYIELLGFVNVSSATGASFGMP